MATKQGQGPEEPLDPKVVTKLLDLLSTDDGFRELFQKDAHAALVEAGYKPSPRATLKAGATAATLSGGACLQLADGVQLASKEQIITERAKLEQSLNAIVNFLCPKELQADQ